MKKHDRKKILIASVAAVLVVAIGLGIWFGVSRGGSEAVKVYPFSYIGMTEYWGDSQDSYGPVTTDKIQTVFLSSTQTVTEIKVAKGDTVKKGDVLMTFDTTLSDLQLERKRLEVEKLKLDLENAQKKLKELQDMEPMSIPDYDDSGDSEDDDGTHGTPLTGSYQLSTNSDYDGSTDEKALICWLNSAVAVDDSLLEAIRQKAEEFQNKNYEPEPPEPSEEPTEESTEEPTTEPTSGPTTEPSAPSASENPDGGEESGEHSSASADTGDPETPAISVSSYYVVFKVTEGNMSLGARTAWEGLHVYKQGGSFRFQFFDASVVPDHSVVTEDPDEDPDIDIPDMGSGYTAAQLAQLRSEQEKKIKELKFNIKITEADYKIMQTEMSDGNVYSQIDGTVVSLLTEDEAKTKNQPLIKVSGGGGFYIQGSVSELDKDEMQIDQEVTVNDWNTGMTYTGKVVSIGDFPSNDDGWSGSGNPNVSYYPFTVFVDETADLQAGQYANIQYSAAASENGIYLNNPFVRTEGGQSYVYVQGENGKLEKRAVTTGKSLWGSYTEILSGLTADDLIAFPYGKNLKPGAPTAEGDMNDLYG